MDIRRQIEAVESGAPPPENPEDMRTDAAVRAMTADERKVLARVLDRWTEAGHPHDSMPDVTALEPDDTGNVFDEHNKALIATADEWTVYNRARRRLEGTEAAG